MVSALHFSCIPHNFTSLNSYVHCRCRSESTRGTARNCYKRMGCCEALDAKDRNSKAKNPALQLLRRMPKYFTKLGMQCVLDSNMLTMYSCCRLIPTIHFVNIYVAIFFALTLAQRLLPRHICPKHAQNVAKIKKQEKQWKKNRHAGNAATVANLVIIILIIINSLNVKSGPSPLNT